MLKKSAYLQESRLSRVNPGLLLCLNPHLTSPSFVLELGCHIIMSLFLSTLLHLLLGASLLWSTAVADECQAVTWENAQRRDLPSNTQAAIRPAATRNVPSKSRLEAGDVNCRFWDQTYEQVNYYSCQRMATANDIDVETFFKLNPEVDRDCNKVRPYTKYCVEGCKSDEML
jgi:hypothetical protein